MLGESSIRQILALAGEGLNSESISRELQIEEALVKLTLSANSSGTAPDRDINDAQLELLRQRAYNLAMGSEDDSVSARMTMFLIERDKPRQEKQSLNINVINQAIIQAKGKMAELTDLYHEV